jgi:hypothetical protein
MPARIGVTGLVSTSPKNSVLRHHTPRRRDSRRIVVVKIDRILHCLNSQAKQLPVACPSSTNDDKEIPEIDGSSKNIFPWTRKKISNEMHHTPAEEGTRRERRESTNHPRCQPNSVGLPQSTRSAGDSPRSASQCSRKQNDIRVDTALVNPRVLVVGARSPGEENNAPSGSRHNFNVVAMASLAPSWSCSRTRRTSKMYPRYLQRHTSKTMPNT